MRVGVKREEWDGGRGVKGNQVSMTIVSITVVSITVVSTLGNRSKYDHSECDNSKHNHGKYNLPTHETVSDHIESHRRPAARQLHAPWLGLG